VSADRYPAFAQREASGLDSCPIRPSHWSVSRLKFFSAMNPSKSEVAHLSGESRVTFLPMEAIGENGELDVSHDRPLGEVKSGYTYLREGDVCLAKITPCFENGKAAVVTGTRSGVAFATTEVIPFRCARPEDARFLYFLLTSAPFRPHAESAMYGAGGQKRVPERYVSSYAVLLPPPTERSQIANFLDYETAKIDTLIEKQQQLIRLLKEKRQAVISHAVTKGLNPDAPMRDSGVEWLGEVPAHWEVKRVKHVCLLESGHTPRRTEPSYWVEDECTVPWVSLNDTRTLDAKDYIAETEVLISPKGMANSSAHLIPSGAVVFNRDGARVGLAAITADEMCVSQHIIAWVCGPEVLNEYLLHVVYAMRPEIYRVTWGSTIPTIGMTDVRQMVCPIPPMPEQRAISDMLFNARERLGRAETSAQESIQLLLERRAALISAAVTGKIDVRGWTPPESATEQEVA